MSEINVLFLSANPQDKDFLGVKNEYKAIEESLRRHIDNGKVKLINAWDVQPTELVSLFQRHRPSIVHFGGHGSEEGILAVDGDGKTQLVDKELFIDLINQYKEYIRIVVLNACHTDSWAKDIAQTIDCVIGNKIGVEDKKAVVFVGTFYEHLASERSIEDAYKCAVLYLKMAGITDDAQLPALEVREGVKPEHIYLTKRTNKGGWLITDPNNWDSFVCILAFSKHIHHMFQTLEDQHLNGIVDTLDRLTKQNDIRSKIDLQVSWENYSKEYSVFLEKAYNFETTIPKALETLKAVNSVDVKEIIATSEVYFKTICSSISDFNQTQQDIHGRKGMILDDLDDLKLTQMLAHRCLKLQTSARQLVTVSDQLIQKMIDVLSME